MTKQFNRQLNLGDRDLFTSFCLKPSQKHLDILADYGVRTALHASIHKIVEGRSMEFKFIREWDSDQCLNKNLKLPVGRYGHSAHWWPSSQPQFRQLVVQDIPS